MTRWLLLGVAVLAAGCGGDETAGWKKTEGGVKYEDVAEGGGRGVKAGDRVSVFYKGWLSNGGKVFDTNMGKAPFTFTLGQKQVIQGWEEGVVGMKPRGRRKLYIPAALAYGDKGSGEEIPPGADLMFEVHLISGDADMGPEEDGR